MSCKQDPENPAFCTGGTTCSSCFPSLLNEEDSSHGFGESSEPLFHSHLEPAAPQDSNTSLPQPVRAESSTFHYCLQQIGDLTNLHNPPSSQYCTSFSQEIALKPKIQTSTEEVGKHFKTGMEFISKLQELQISENKQNEIRKEDSSGHQQISNENSSIVSRDLHSSIRKPIEGQKSEIQELQFTPNMAVQMHPYITTAGRAVIPNQPIANQGLLASIRKPIESGRCEIQELQFTPNMAIQMHPYASTAGRAVILYPSLPIATLVCPLPAYHFTVGCEAQNTSSVQPSESVGGKEDFDFSMAEIPHSFRYERVNIVLYGPAIWSSKLLQTFSGMTPYSYVWPCSLSCQWDFVHGPISVSAFFWQTEDIEKSGSRIRDLYNTSKTTIVVVENIGGYLMSLEELTRKIRHEINEKVPIILVVCRYDEHNKSNTSEISAFIEDGCILKARHNLSGYLECILDSAKEVENVFFTAMDLSQLNPFS